MAARSRTPKRSRSQPDSTPPLVDERFELPSLVLLGLTGALALVYFALSFVSDGFYQHDEVAHFVGMRQFWHDPSSALGNWAKPGYKAIYAFPALLGPTFVALFNACVAAASVWAATRIGQRLGVRAPLLVFGLAAFQPMWVALAFRNYSELPTALLLTLAVWAHVHDRRLLAALLLSYACTIRQEFFLLAGLYGLWLLGKRAWLPALALALFPLVNHLWGWAATGDPTYLLTDTLGFGSALADAYPRQGFWHYFSTSEVIFGALPLAALVAFGVSLAAKRPDGQRWGWHPFVLVPVGLYFAAHVAFQVQAVSLGPATGGNLRYLTVIGPLVAVLGALGIERAPELPKSLLAAALGLLVLVAAVYLSYEHNNVRLTEVRSAGAFVRMLVAAGLILLPLALRLRTLSIAAAALVFAIATFQPFERTSEDALMEVVAEWAQLNQVDERPLLVVHPLFHYFNSKAPGDYPQGATPILGPSVDTARVGTYVVWDSHYSYRPEKRPDDVSFQMLLADSARFRLVRNPFLTTDQRFGVLVFEKIAP
jgi:hypothetical protein